MEIIYINANMDNCKNCKSTFNFFNFQKKKIKIRTKNLSGWYANFKINDSFLISELLLMRIIE